MVCHEASLTGAPRIGFDTALFLAASHEVHLVVKAGGPLIEQPRYAALRALYRNVETQDISYAKRLKRVNRVLADICPDLLYVNSVAAGDWCEAGARSGAAVVLHTHEMKSNLSHIFAAIIKPRCLSQVNLLVSASQEAMNDLQAFTGGRFENSMNLGVFVDAADVLSRGEQRVAPPVNAAGGAPRSGRRRIGMCGIAEPRKGADLFLHLASRLPEYDFVWIGPWHVSSNPAMYSPLSSLDNFYVTGQTDNPYAHFRTLDAFVLTSREDPNPLVVPEALLFGIPVVAFSETGGSKKMLERFGYVLSGTPDSGRLAAILPAIVDGARGLWLSQQAGRLRSEIDWATKLPRLQRALEDLTRRSRNQRDAVF